MNKKNNTTMKEGDEIIMCLDCFGVISEEKQKITAINDKTITVDAFHGSNDEPYIFNRKTGKCINYTSSFGGTIFIKIENKQTIL